MSPGADLADIEAPPAPITRQRTIRTHRYSVAASESSYTTYNSRDSSHPSADASYDPTRIHKAFRWFRRLPSSTKTLFYLSPAGLLFSALYLADIQALAGKGKGLSVLSIPLRAWCKYLGSMWVAFFGCILLLHIIPNFLQYLLAICGVARRRHLAHLTHLHFPISLSVMSFVGMVLWGPLIVGHLIVGGNSVPVWADRTFRVLNVLFLASLVLLVEKVLLQAVATSFHATTYRDRINIARTSAWLIRRLDDVLPELADSVSSNTPIPFMFPLKSRTISRADKADEEKTEGDGAGCHPRVPRFHLGHLTRAVGSATTLLGTIAADIAIVGVRGEEGLSPDGAAPLASSRAARSFARRLHGALCPTAFHVMTPLHLMSLGIFETLADAKDAFRILCPDRYDISAPAASSGRVEVEEEDRADEIHSSEEEIEGEPVPSPLTGPGMTLLETIRAMEATYRERRTLMRSMRDLDNAVGRLDKILLVLVGLIDLLIAISNTNVTASAYLASAGSLLLAFTFMMGSTAQAIFESCVLLFLHHPFDVGDTVEVHGERLRVREMFLLHTVFARLPSNASLTYPNHLLLQTHITNHRRSGDTVESIVVEVAWETASGKIQMLEERMRAFVRSSRRDYIPESFALAVHELWKCHRLSLRLLLPYRGNLHDGHAMGKRRNAFLLTLRKEMDELELNYTGPLNRVVQEEKVEAEAKTRDIGGEARQESTYFTRPYYIPPTDEESRDARDERYERETE